MTRSFPREASVCRPRYRTRLTTLISIVVRFVRSVHGHTDIGGLLRREGGQLCADLPQMETRNLFIEFFGKHKHRRLVNVSVFPKVELGEGLIGETVAHNKARMSGGA